MVCLSTEKKGCLLSGEERDLNPREFYAQLIGLFKAMWFFSVVSYILQHNCIFFPFHCAALLQCNDYMSLVQSFIISCQLWLNKEDTVKEEVKIPHPFPLKPCTFKHSHLKACKKEPEHLLFLRSENLHKL